MSYFVLIGLTGLMIALIGLASWHLEMRERDERLAAEALQTAQVLDAELEERLREMDRYRHDLAALLQELGLEQVRAAEERGQD